MSKVFQFCLKKRQDLGFVEWVQDSQKHCLTPLKGPCYFEKTVSDHSEAPCYLRSYLKR